MKTGETLFAMAAAATIGALTYAPAALADTDVTETWMFSKGGKLYDHWSNVLFREMKDVATHPSYPKAGKHGARFYQSICAICQGFDGKQLNFKTPEDPEFIGTVTNENPWEALHKIRNGQPGIPMPSEGVLELKDQVDIDLRADPSEAVTV